MPESKIKGLFYDCRCDMWRARFWHEKVRYEKWFKTKELAATWLTEQYAPIAKQKETERLEAESKKKEEAERVKEERRLAREANKKAPLTEEERKAIQRAWYAANKEKIVKKHREDRINNPEKYAACKAKARAVYHSDPKYKEQAKLSNRRSRKNNPEKARAHESRREKAKIQRVPTWAWKPVREYETGLRKEMAILTQETGLVYNIDHIVPLRAATRLQDGTLLYLASGLHVPDNLQILEAGENLAKSCWDWPDRWDYTETDINELEVLHERVTTESHSGLAHARTDAERSSGDGGTRIKELGEHA